MVAGIVFFVVSLLFTLYYWMMIIYFLSSWIPSFRESAFIEKIGSIVEPYLSFFRKIIPPIGIIDISSIVALFTFVFIKVYALEGLRVILTMFIGK